MRKTNYFKSSLMILLFCIGFTSLWGQTEITGTFSTFGFTNGQTFPSGNLDGNISFTTEKNSASNDPAYFTTGSNIRLYAGSGNGGSMTLSASNGVVITNVIFYGVSGNVANAKYFIDGSTSSTAISAVGNNYTINGLNVTQSLKFQHAATSGQIRLTGVKVTYTSATPCNEGTLTGGTTVAAPAEVVSGGTSALSLSGASTGTGLSYQWQSSADGTTWSDISTATSSTYSATNITAKTYFKAKVTCGTTTVESTPVLVTLAYCSAGSGDTDYETISNFTYGTINNNSTFVSGGYQNFAAINTDIEMGAEIPFSVSLAESYATDQVLIWIDLNQNSVFDANELLFESAISDANPVTGTITIPATATEGSTRLRIRLHDSDGSPANNTPCGTSEYGEVEDYIVNILPSSTITWLAGGGWSNGTGPTSTSDDVVIEGALVTSGDLSAKNLTVISGGSLTVSTGNTLTLAGKIINEAGAANFVVASGANLIQDATYTTNDNEGEITVLRDSNPIKRLDYTLWSSPVTGQELQAFSPQTVSTRIYTYETTAANEATGGAYVVVPSATADFANAKGYLFRAPNDASATVSTPYEGEFVGVPFNGNVTSPVYSSDYTSVGNPYASNIEADAFLAANSNVAALYFWNNTGVAGANYSTCTLGNCVAASGGGVTPNGFITVGQGFLVETTAGSTVSFDNSMRVSNAGVFSKNDSEKNRIWLNLNNEQNEGLNQILVGYMAGATNNVDHQIDAKLFASETSALYNIIGEEKFVIQGKALPFVTSDVVALGFKAAEAGKFNISLNNFDGLFAEGEVVVYLKDKELNITHNLMESAYAFESAAGEFNTRFEVVYEEEVMGTGDLNANAVQIYTSNDQIVVSSKSEKILSVELFDLQGRNIHTNNKVNASTYQIKSASKGVLVVKVLTQNGEVVTKKVINK